METKLIPLWEELWFTNLKRVAEGKGLQNVLFLLSNIKTTYSSQVLIQLKKILKLLGDNITEV